MRNLTLVGVGSSPAYSGIPTMVKEPQDQKESSALHGDWTVESSQGSTHADERAEPDLGRENGGFDIDVELRAASLTTSILV